jgi:hypothetical protein
MELTLTGQLVNIFKKDDFTNEETGEVKQGKHTAQFMESRKQKDGSVKNTLSDVTIPEEIFKKISEKVGSTVTIKVGVWAQNNRHGLYGIA